MSGVFSFGLFLFGLGLVGVAYGIGISSYERNRQQVLRWRGMTAPPTSPEKGPRYFVAAQRRYDDSITSAIFENGRDYIGHPDTWEDVDETMAELTKEGFIENMTLEQFHRVSAGDWS